MTSDSALAGFVGSAVTIFCILYLTFRVRQLVIASETIVDDGEDPVLDRCGKLNVLMAEHFVS